MKGAVFEFEVARAVRRHALGWLLVANLAGLYLAALLVWPGLGGGVPALGYGRWMPVHLDGQLYGWCALPLVGALLAACLEPRHLSAPAHARLALRAWSGALTLGAVAWIGGRASGKLFLDWSGWARVLPALAMSVSWALLAAHLWWGRGRRGTARWRVAAGLLAMLGVVPALFYWAAGREVYPAANPDSGGATGASLLGSTLGIVAVLGLLPILLGVRRREGRREAWFWWALIVSFVVCGMLERGNASHHAAGQIAGLGLLLLWMPLLWLHGRGWEWSAASTRWAAAAGVWWVLLVTDGWLSFLPGFSEAGKFTHALVAHAHLAMAGFLTSVNFVVLNELCPGHPIGGRAVFRIWQLGCVAYVGLMLALGMTEAEHPAELFHGAEWTRWIFAGRLAAGIAMTAAAALAWREANADRAMEASR